MGISLQAATSKLRAEKDKEIERQADVIMDYDKKAKIMQVCGGPLVELEYWLNKKRTRRSRDKHTSLWTTTRRPRSCRCVVEYWLTKVMKREFSPAYIWPRRQEKQWCTFLVLSWWQLLCCVPTAPQSTQLCVVSAVTNCRTTSRTRSGWMLSWPGYSQRSTP